MSALTHYLQSQIIQQLIVDLSLGASPDSKPLGAWPVYYSKEPSTPDNCLTVFDTEPVFDGRMMFDGEYNEHYGFQVKVRASLFPSGVTKAATIATQFDGVLRQEVTVVDGSGVGTTNYNYLVHSISRRSGPVYLGTQVDADRLHLFTINFTTTISLTSIEAGS